MTGSATAEALARILGRRVDQLTTAVRDAIAALEADEATRETGTSQPVIDMLRGAL